MSEMKVTTLISMIKKVWAADMGYETVKEWQTDNDVRLRVTKAARFEGDNVIEVGTSYFYEVQGRPKHNARNFEIYSNHIGIPVELVPVSDKIDFSMKPWAKTSWATQLFEVNFQ